MNNTTNNTTNKPYGCSTITIAENSPPKPTPTHLVLTLHKERQRDVQKKIEIYENKTQKEKIIDSSSDSFQSLSSSSEEESLKKSSENFTSKSVIKVEVKGLKESSESSEEYKSTKQQRAINVLKEEDEILKDEIIFAETGIESDEQISTLNTLFHMATEFAQVNGTSIFSTMTTFGYGITNTLASEGYIAPVIGGVALVVAGNEFLKMLSAYVNQKGMSDHMKGIELALEGIKKKNELAKKVIEESLEKQQEIKNDIKSTQEKIDILKSQLNNTTEKFHANIINALEVQHSINAELEAQEEAINNAIEDSKNASSIIVKQLKLLEKFKLEMENTKFTIKSDEDVENLIEMIQAEINEITALSSNALEHQTNASEHILSALSKKSSIFMLNDRYLQLLLDLQIIEEKYKMAQGIITDINGKLNDANEKVNDLGGKLNEANDIIDDQKILISIGQDEFEVLKNQETFGTESVNWGGMGAVVTGLGAGFVTFGPPGAIVGVLAVGVCGIKPAVALAHLARKTWKSYSNTQLELEFENCKTNLLNPEKFNPKGKITVSSKFGVSTAKFVGVWRGGTAFHNYLYAPVNNLFFTEQLAQITSHKVGTLNCTFGGVNLPALPFNINDEENPLHTTYGAITVNTQMQLSALFLQLLMDNVVPPQMILDFLESLEKVEVSGVDDKHKEYTTTLCMIEPKSKAMKTLKKICSRKLEACKAGKEVIFKIKKTDEK